MTHAGFDSQRQLIRTFALLGVLIGLSSYVQAQVNSALANPASQNCQVQGGTLKIETNPAGGQFGVCYFEDNLQCEEWAMLRGQCRRGGIKVTGFVSPAARYCAITGGSYKVTSDSNHSGEKGTCVLRGGKTCEANAYFIGACSATTTNGAAVAVEHRKASSATTIQAQYRCADDKLARQRSCCASLSLASQLPGATARSRRFKCASVWNESLITTRNMGSSIGPSSYSKPADTSAAAGFSRTTGRGHLRARFQLCIAFWGRGFAREAAEAVVVRAFTTLGVRALYAGHHPDNQASRGVLRHLGFNYTHDEFYPPTGQIEPCYLLRRSDFREFSAP